MSEKDPLAGGKEVSTQAVSFGKVGDYIKGTYTGKKTVKTMNGERTLYELKGAVGMFHAVDGKKNPVEPVIEVVPGAYYQVWGGKDEIDGLFAKSRLGDIVAVKFDSEQESKTKGHAPFKKMKTLQFGPDKDYMGEESGVVDTAEAAKDM